jgi:hypothetical protein
MIRILIFLTILAGGCAYDSVVDCERLLAIDGLPMKTSYSELLEGKGIEDSVGLRKCLAANIVSTVSTKDPRGAPVVQSYVEGDNAFFLLALKYDWKIEDFLDEEHRDKWDSEGIYAYFQFVSNQKNRESLADAVRSRLAD